MQLNDWHKDVPDSDPLKIAIAKEVSDLVFDMRNMGTGAAFNAEKLKLMDKDDKKREVIGTSARRKCMYLVTVADGLTNEWKTDQVTISLWA